MSAHPCIFGAPQQKPYLELPKNFMAPFSRGGGNNALASPTFKKGAGGFSRYTLTREPRNGVEPTVGVLGVPRRP